jgi:hypothetical protein
VSADASGQPYRTPGWALVVSAEPTGQPTPHHLVRSGSPLVRFAPSCPLRAIVCGPASLLCGSRRLVPFAPVISVARSTGWRERCTIRPEPAERADGRGNSVVGLIHSFHRKAFSESRRSLFGDGVSAMITPNPWEPTLIQLASELKAAGFSGGEVARLARRAELRRVRRGAYARTDAAPQDEREAHVSSSWRHCGSADRQWW